MKILSNKKYKELVAKANEKQTSIVYCRYDPHLEKEIKELKIDYSQANDIIVEQSKQIERLTAESTEWESKFYDETKKVDKAIEYLENIPRVLTRTDVIFLLMILKGEENEKVE